MKLLKTQNSSDFTEIDENVHSSSILPKSTENIPSYQQPAHKVMNLLKKLESKRSNSHINLHALEKPRIWNEEAKFTLIPKDDLFSKPKAERSMLESNKGDDAVTNYSPKKQSIIFPSNPSVPSNAILTQSQIVQLTMIKECIDDIKFYLTLPPKQPVLEKGTKKILALDLDETLIYSVPFIKKVSIKTYSVCYKNGDIVRIAFRPYLDEFLTSIRKFYRIVIFTSSDRKYAEPRIRMIDPKKEIFSWELYRSHCVSMKDKFYMKNLSILGDLSSIILVDNLMTSFSLQMDNGICIQEFKGEANDTELQWLMPYLISISSAPDVRTELNKAFGYSEKLYRIMEDPTY
jgi:Dullard-like phosphatase family protein